LGGFCGQGRNGKWKRETGGGRCAAEQDTAAHFIDLG
jgi:hypothetical protein